MSEAIMVFCTTPSAEISQKICDFLIREELAACCNILPSVTSVYKWKGELQTDTENLLLIKTTRGNYTSVEKVLKDIHPYEVPEIIFSNIEGGSADYLNWISQNTRNSNE